MLAKAAPPSSGPSLNLLRVTCYLNRRFLAALGAVTTGAGSLPIGGLPSG